MSTRRFIADQVSGDRAVLEGAHAEHLTRVLRARIGQEFEVAVEGQVRRGRIVHLENERVEFELGGEISGTVSVPVTLYLAVFKFDRMEWAIEKCTELGVARLVPLICTRTDAHLAAAAEKRVERWRRLALQASEQSRRTTPPEIASPVRLSRETATVAGPRIVLAESERQVMLREVLGQGSAEWEAADANLTLAIGPEGGWTSSECKIFSQTEWTSASLGSTILRAETAAIAAVAVVQAFSGH
jgi:16S rRNA (uracil1498-N3)-methyltransferase